MSQVSEKEARNLFDLTIYIRMRLELRLPMISLKLDELKLVALTDTKVLAPGATGAYALNGVVVRPESKQAKAFSIRIDLDPSGDMDRKELDPLVEEIVDQLKIAFYRVSA